jgi:hypothetical protein
MPLSVVCDVTNVTVSWREAGYTRWMVTIAITFKAFAVIAATLPKGYIAQLRPDGSGGFLATLPNGALDGFVELRRPSESWSDVILRMAGAELRRELQPRAA